MKKVLMIALAVLISVAFVTSVFAAGEKPVETKKPVATEKPEVKVEKPVVPEKPTKPVKVKVMKYSGEVAKVDGMVVVVKGKKDEKTFDVSQAKFKGYKDATEIKGGDKVKVTYTEADGKAMAKTFAKSAAPKKKAEKPEEAKKAVEKPPVAPEKK